MGSAHRMEKKMGASWEGRDVSTLTKEELVEAYTRMVCLLEEERKRHLGDLEMFSLFFKARKSLMKMG